MQITFTGHDFDITAALKQLTIDKLERICSRFNIISNIHITFTKEHLKHIALATVHVVGTDISAHGESDDMYKSIDLMISKLMVQLTKHKEKLTNHRD